MKPKYIYIGCFVSPEELFKKVDSLRRGPLYRSIQAPHVTFAYKPRQVDDSLFGEIVEITINGYGNDGYNEGVSVSLTSTNPVIRELYKEIAMPHITLSVSRDGKPVDTRFLDFEPVEPIRIQGIFGAYTDRGTIITKPFQRN